MTRVGMMQQHIWDRNCVTGGKFPSFLANRAQNNRVIDHSSVGEGSRFSSFRPN